MLFVTCAVGAAALYRFGDAEAVERAMAFIGPWARAGQLLLVAGLWWHWDGRIDWLARRGRIGPNGARALRQARHRLCTAALVLVLALGFSPVWAAEPAGRVLRTGETPWA